MSRNSLLLLLLGFCFCLSFVNELGSNWAEQEALREQIIPVYCHSAQDSLTWFDWWTEPAAELRRAECADLIAADRRARIWWQVIPNPLLVLVKFVSLVLLQPVQVLVQVSVDTFLHVVVQLGWLLALFLLVFLLAGCSCVGWYFRWAISNSARNYSHGITHTEIRPQTDVFFIAARSTPSPRRQRERQRRIAVPDSVEVTVWQSDDN